MIGKRLLEGSSALARTSSPCWNTMISGLEMKSGESRILKSTEPTSTSAPGFQTKLRP
jgi:hypothetical protein